jgi:rod shape-determining protein MreC
MALLASLTLIFIDSRLNYLTSIRSTLSTAIYPIQRVASLPSDLVSWTNQYLQSRADLKEHNKSLQATNLLSSFHLQKLRGLERENLRLRELLGSSFRLPERVQVAEVLRVDSALLSQHVVINKGEKDAVFEGQSVLDSSGVMGQVMTVSQFSSRVILVTDPSHGTPVQVNRNGLRSVARGRGLNKLLQLEYLPHKSDIRAGDLLVTSGLSGRFPAGYPVGTVIKVTESLGKKFSKVTVEPAANIATSREVLLVLPLPDDETIAFDVVEVIESDEDEVSSEDK